MSRAAAAEFSFLVGLPILHGACALELWKMRHALHGELLRDLTIGGAVAFVPFAVYRLCAGVAILSIFAL